MRRSSALVPLVAALAAGALAAPVAAGQASGDGATFADSLGLPELEITGTDGGFEGVPAETAAGRYVVTFTNDTELDGGVDFVQLPEGKSVDDLSLAAEFLEEDEPTAEEMEEAMANFAWVYDTYVAGGVGGGPGSTGQVIVDLLPGDYGVWSDDPTSPISPVALEVTGEMPADLPEPEADVTLTEVGTAEGYAFELDGELTPGAQTIRIDNKSDQPHFVVFIGSPEPVTMEQVEALLMFDPESGDAPPPGMPDLASFTFPTYAATQSTGTTQWLATDLEPGTYILACFVADPGNGGIPHAAEGMVEIVTVGDV